MKTLFCIKHQSMERAYKGAVTDFVHEIPIRNEFGHVTDLDWCEFDQGYATTPPPEFDMDNWIENLTYKDDATSQVDNLTRVFEFIP